MGELTQEERSRLDSLKSALNGHMGLEVYSTTVTNEAVRLTVVVDPGERTTNMMIVEDEAGRYGFMVARVEKAPAGSSSIPIAVLERVR